MIVTPCNNCGSQDWQPCFEENGYTLGQCRACDLLYIQPMPASESRMTEMEGGHFAAGAQRVLVAAKQSAAEASRHLLFNAYLDIVRPHAPSGRWLEIGCGAGHMMGVAEQAGYTVEGVELTADRRAAAKAAGYTVHGRTVEDLAFAPASFNIISLIDVFSHLTHPAGTLTELRRILCPGGIILIATGELDSAPRKGDVYRWNLGDHLFFLGKRTIQSLADRTGFRVMIHERTWLPSDIYTKARLSIGGRSMLRNFGKWLIVKTPGVLPIVRGIMLHRHASNPAHSAVILLAPR